ncbi:hypothetical protein ACFPES_02070 [Paenibacillus sp. GCM10023248]|uniref:hypothetical protein n=1 Tax=Bacillales TaxID=1385 RepID=UPI002379C137|nr:MULTISPECIES: hypothetical protein [Bacillales]MDD9265809.1 hypothetical protein [Paenibacillus sp. MAHUQ-63]MDR6879048.1 hypothetical protein [Bacillus sp. 3255]
MSVKSNPIPGFPYELDIVKVARSLGIDQDRLLAYVYDGTDSNKGSEHRSAHLLELEDLT